MRSAHREFIVHNSVNFPTKHTCHSFCDCYTWMLMEPKAGSTLYPHFLLLFQITMTIVVLFLHLWISVTNFSTYLPPKAYISIFVTSILLWIPVHLQQASWELLFGDFPPPLCLQSPSSIRNWPAGSTMLYISFLSQLPVFAGGHALVML